MNEPARPGPAASHWDQRWFRAFGSDAHVIVGGAGDLGAWVIEEAERLEQCWSRFRPDAELVLLNRSPRATVSVSALMIDIAERARAAWLLTAGWFDPTILDALEHAGYRSTFESRASWPASVDPDLATDLDTDLDTDHHADSPDPPAVPGYGSVQIDRAASTITRPPGVRLDWGGIGKGLAADLLATGLIERGAAQAVVGLGGDVRVAGRAPANGWAIPVEVPGSPGTEWFSHHLGSGAIVTSSTRDRCWTAADGSARHHLIDPRTATSSRSGVSAVVVVADEAWRAEVLAKAALIAGPDAGLELLARAGVTAWMVDDDGGVVRPDPAALDDAVLDEAADEPRYAGVVA